jgi:adenylosuccinate synthase
MWITFWVSSKPTPLAWCGPFPTELFDETGEFLCKQGNEFGATTGRRRRTGWLDAVAVRRAVQINSLSGFCLTKLDVLDGLKEVKICVGYRMPDGREVTTTPLAADNWEGIEPITKPCRAGLKPPSA